MSEQVKGRLTVATSFLSRSSSERRAVLPGTVYVDETRARSYEPDMKRQGTKKWPTPASANLQVSKHSLVKTPYPNITFAFDKHGIPVSYTSSADQTVNDRRWKDSFQLSYKSQPEIQEQS